ncbi:MAG: hypothetical protein M3O26_02650 [Pseudomonadota bacterium]|nr:hypothetical protein [Pseudomonadota bacterium]
MTRMNMASAIPKLIGGLVLGALIPLSCMALSEDTDTDVMYRHHSIEGTWDTTVTLRVCGSGAVIRTFRAMSLFGADGSLVATSVVAPPPSLGQWWRVGPDRYLAKMQLFRYDTTGAFLGVQQLTRTISMNESGTEFSSIVTVEIFDPLNNPIANGCSTEISKRLF